MNLDIGPRSHLRDQKKAKAYQEIPIMISARSGYHELGSFISKLENADRFMEVSDIKLKANSANFRKHNVELIVSTYLLVNE